MAAIRKCPSLDTIHHKFGKTSRIQRKIASEFPFLADYRSIAKLSHWLPTKKSQRYAIHALKIQTAIESNSNQNCVVVNEPPTGMKLNMRSLFYNMRHDAFEATSHWAFKSILYIVGFFHAIVQVITAIHTQQYMNT